MKKLLSLTTMAMIALATPTLSANTTANTTKTVKKNNASKTVDYSKMNYEQLEKIAKKAKEEDTMFALQASGILNKFYTTGSEANYKKMLDLHKKVIAKRENLIKEIDKRKEKYDKYHENNHEAYEAYWDLSLTAHSAESMIKAYADKYRELLDEKNRLNSY